MRKLGIALKMSFERKWWRFQALVLGGLLLAFGSALGCRDEVVQPMYGVPVLMYGPPAVKAETPLLPDQSNVVPATSLASEE